MSFNKSQIIFFGLAAHLLTAFFSIGYHQCDELFQVYEFAGYKLGINRADELPWEYAAQMRSGIQPLIIYIFTKGCNALSIYNPFTISLLVRLAMSICAFVAMAGLLQMLEEQITSPPLKKWLWALGLLFWCGPYFHARFSSENFSATLFVFGLLAALKSISAPRSPLFFLLAGFFFGLAFMCRFQTIFMIVGFAAWLLWIQKETLKIFLPAFAGLLLAIGAGVLADKWLYSVWTFSPWNYLNLNLFQNKAAQFGHESLFYYLGEGLLQLIPPFSLFILAALVFFWIRFCRHMLTWITLPFILLHFFVGHKELRFLFPALNFLPFMLIYVWQYLEGRQHPILNLLRRRWLTALSLGVNLLLLAYFMFKPADTTSFMLKKIYDVVQGSRPVLLYKGNNPYSNANSLNYFRNRAIHTMDIEQDSIHYSADASVYYFSGRFKEEDVLVKNNRVFVKQYSNFPAWFSYLNFNGWLERSGSFSIYRTRNRELETRNAEGNPEPGINNPK